MTAIIGITLIFSCSETNSSDEQDGAIKIKDTYIEECKWDFENYSQTDAENPSQNSPIERGKVIESTYLTSMDKETLGNLIPTGFPEAKNGVHIYNVKYKSIDVKGEEITLSERVLVPDVCQESYPLIALQHATILDNNNAPTLNGPEGYFDASQGYAVVVQDYIGYGESKDSVHPYLMAGAYANTGIDAIRSVRLLAAQNNVDLKKELFIKGYSEGAYATLAIQREIEANYGSEFIITASAAASGPYDMLAMGYSALSQEDTNPYISFVITSYFEYIVDASAMLISDVFQSSVVDVVSDAFSGDNDYDAITDMLPQKNEDLVTEQFRTSFLDKVNNLIGGGSPDLSAFELALKENSLNSGWAPISPTKLYHCKDDELVPELATENTYSSFESANGNVEKEIIESISGSAPFTHETCPALLSPVIWFDTFLQP